MKWSNRIPWFKALGGMILFMSWISQNYFMAEQKEELGYLELVQTLISIEEGHYSEWLTLLIDEQRKESPDSIIIKNAALKSAQHQLNILTWATARVTEDSTHYKLLQDTNELRNKLLLTYQDDDQNELIDLLNAILLVANNEGQKLIDTANQNYANAKDRSELWNKRFLVLYIIGTILLGIGITKKWLSENKNV